MDITEAYNDDCYNDYYSKNKYTDEYYNALAERDDRNWEDR